MALKALWKRLPISNSILNRSSQVIAVINSNLTIFSGELQPRVPVPADTYSIPLSSPPLTTIPTIAPDAFTPSPRVGAAGATLNSKLYLFGGRGGKAMDALNENGRVWVFDPSTSTWSHLDPKPDAPIPGPRSYHAAAAWGNKLFIHAGCPKSGRLDDLWAFDVEKIEWKDCASSPGGARGGTSLTAVDEKLYRMHGFDGKEIGGSVDCYDIVKNKWESYSYPPDSQNGPGARSVAALLPIEHNNTKYLITLFGERGPSDRGHEGAGQFWDDVWAFNLEMKEWSRVDARGDGGIPESRGWFDADSWKGENGKYRIVVQGGLNDENERLGDVWVLEFE